MKDGLKHIVGKKIVGVVVAKADRQPKQQVFLTFSDGSSFEFYGEAFTCCAGLDESCRIERYIESGNGQVVGVYGHAAHESLESLMTRDLAAWREAKALIDRAKRA